MLPRISIIMRLNSVRDELQAMKNEVDELLRELEHDSIKVFDLKSYMHAIADEVATERQVPLARLIGPSREHAICRARDEAIAAIYSTGKFSSTQIGRFFGGRDHSTILSAIKRHEDRLAMRDGSATIEKQAASRKR